MNDKYDAVIVGAGLAGLTCGAYLAKYGYHTIICEKNNKTGGLVNSFWYKGFLFDAGIRAFENSGIVIPMLNDLGIDLKLTKNPVSIIIEDRKTVLSSIEDLDKYAGMLKYLFPENQSEVSVITDEIRKSISHMNILYGIDNPLFTGNMHDINYLKKTLLPWLIKYLTNINKVNRVSEPINLYLQKFTDSISLVDMITQHFFKNTPAFFALSYFNLYLDYSYPPGGTGILPQKLSEYILNCGGNISTDSRVTIIDPLKHQIQLDNGISYGYKKLIWAADQKSLYKGLTDYHTKNTENQKALVEKCIGGDSILTVYIGANIDKNYFADICGAHAFFTPLKKGISVLSSWEDAAQIGNDELFKWLYSYLQLTTYEISCPSLRDESLAPKGNTGIIASTLMDYRLVRYFENHGLYGDFKQFCSDKIISVLASSLFPDFVGNILFAFCSTPLTIERETGNSNGAITGWAFNSGSIPSVTNFKDITKSIRTPITDILQCGQWTFSPSGLPVSILTGKLAADAIRKKNKGRAL